MDYNKCGIDKELNVEDTLEYEGLNMLLTLCLKSRTHVSIKVYILKYMHVFVSNPPIFIATQFSLDHFLADVVS